MTVEDLKKYISSTVSSQGTVNNYIGCLTRKTSPINKALRKANIISNNIFEINDAQQLELAKQTLAKDTDYIKANRKTNNNCSAAFGKFYVFFYNPNALEERETPPDDGDIDANPSAGAEPSGDDVDMGEADLYARNWIVFGAPGTGKSYKLDNEKIKLLGIDKNKPSDKEDQYERVTFYPDYSYANFIGTYKPVPATDEKGNIVKDTNRNDVITYKYVPGPFMRIYVKAKSHPDKDYLLIIEEINRANAAAVFGDVFQLLDRNKNGESEYSVQVSEDARNYLKEKLGDASDECSKIRIPSNMYIWATMNSADQGVYPLDTAFKRRWSFEYIGIDDAKGALSKKYVNLGKGRKKHHVKWDNLRMAINNFLSKEKINEDKQLGPYFIDPEIIPDNVGKDDDTQDFIDVFKDKVLMYLYEDAARQKRDKLFSESRYSDICSHFDELGVYVFKEVIWTEEYLADDLHGAQEQEEAKNETEEDETGNGAGSGEMDESKGKADGED